MTTALKPFIVRNFKKLNRALVAKCFLLETTDHLDSEWPTATYSYIQE